MPLADGIKGPRFNATHASNVLIEACRRSGLDQTSFQLIRIGENALFLLPQVSIVVRIARSLDHWSDAIKEVNVARWLSGLEFPAAEAAETPQPLDVMGHPVTFWRFIDGRDGGPGDLPLLGTVLRHLHELPAPRDFALPQEDIMGRVGSRILKSTISSGDKSFLNDRLDWAREVIRELDFPLALAPTHGDAHAGNLMICGNSQLLIDFERFAWGHPEWDLSMTATEYASAGWWTDAQYQKFVIAYGYDVMAWEGFPILQKVHELKMTTWLMQNIDESAEIRDEFHARMETIRTGRPSGWHPF